MLRGASREGELAPITSVVLGTGAHRHVMAAEYSQGVKELGQERDYKKFPQSVLRLTIHSKLWCFLLFWLFFSLRSRKKNIQKDQEVSKFGNRLPRVVGGASELLLSQDKLSPL